MVSKGQHGIGPCTVCKRDQRGFTYLWVLVAIAVVGLGLTAVSEVWVTSAGRQKRVELEWIGDQFTQAIGSYYQSTPGTAKAYPPTLQDLIEDRRYATVRRHLRVVYANPFTGRQDWELVIAADGRIRGVRVAVPSAEANLAREFIYQPGLTNQ
jgi:type II secretory pathway pseudopilin PulG